MSRYNATVTDALLDGAVAAYVERGGKEDDVTVVRAPGAYELPALALAAAQTGRFSGVVALGCLIKGETKHDQYIAQAVANGLVDVTMRTGVPCAFGVLTTETPEQALARSGGKKGNKGREAMEAVLETIDAMRELEGGAGVVRTKIAGPGFRKRPTESKGGLSKRPDKAAGAGRGR